MKLSYFTMPLHPKNRNYLETLNEDREAFLLADRLGYYEAFVGEHVTDQAETVTSSLMFLASLAYQTKNIKLGSGTVNLPNAHPAAVAAQVAMIDHMLEGRFIFGISPGGLLSDAEVFGNLDRDRKAMFAESIQQILQIWKNDPPYDLKGDFWDISTQRTLDEEIGQGIFIKPYQRPSPPIMVACMSPFSESVKAAAINGWSIISANFLQPIWVASHWEMLCKGWSEANMEFVPQDWRVAKSIFVADDEKTALKYAMDPKGPYGHYYSSLMKKLIGNGRPDLFKDRRDMPDSDVTHDFVMRKLIIYGTSEQVAEKIVNFREEVGNFETLVYAGHDWGNPELSRRSMELMAQEVMPLVNNALYADHNMTV
ncbi:MAG: LLM class flavin-dependent oxidoreductase [Proteobacteria bacterium]|nr:LLM class flavin-dependent oxidoreductase [Pseudomonadota bacterium]